MKGHKTDMFKVTFDLQTDCTKKQNERFAFAIKYSRRDVCSDTKRKNTQLFHIKSIYNNNTEETLTYNYLFYGHLKLYVQVVKEIKLFKTKFCLISYSWCL